MFVECLESVRYQYRHIILLLSIILLLLVGVSYLDTSVYASESQGGNWPMFLRDPNHTGFNFEETTLRPPLEVKWIYQPGGHASPVVKDGTVYFKAGGMLRAVDANTGEEKWTHPVAAGSHSSPAVADGLILHGNPCNGCTFEAVNAGDGGFAWGIVLPKGARDPVVVDGVAYFGSDDQYVRAVRISDGAVLWTSPKLNDGVTSVPAVGSGKVFVGTWNSRLYALNASTGIVEWVYVVSPVKHVIFSSPSVSDGTVYFGSGDAFVHAIDATTGAIKWVFGPTMDSVWGSPAVANGMVYIQALAGKIYALDAETGAFVWDYQTGAPPSSSYSSAAVANGIVHVGSSDGFLYLLDAITGDLLWSYETGAPIIASPAVANGMVYVGSGDGKLYAFGPAGLSVPHLSQKNPNWKDEEYDFASLFNPVGSREIEDLGCALTSAAMILKYHGFNRGPDGQETNPLNLNAYLKQDFSGDPEVNGPGYTQHGGVIWSYITKYAEDAKKNGHVSNNLPSLEFSYPAYSFETLKEDIEATNPGIIKIVMNDKGTSDQYDDDLHFVVGKGVSNSTVYINDPLDLADTHASLDGSYAGKTYRQLARFTKSGTDLSYLWLYLYSDVVNILVEYNGQKTGTDETGQEFSEIPGAQYFAEGAIFNPDSLVRFGGEESGAKVFLLPKPQEGEYKFTFSGEETGFMDYELHAFDQDADVQVFSDSIFVNEEHPTQLLLNYSEDGDLEFAELQKQVDFETLRNDIWAMRRLGHTKHDLIAQVLARIITAAEKVYPHNPNTTYRLLIAFEKLLHAFHPRLVDDIAHEFLLEELEILRSSI